MLLAVGESETAAARLHIFYSYSVASLRHWKTITRRPAVPRKFCTSRYGGKLDQRATDRAH